MYRFSILTMHSLPEESSRREVVSCKFGSQNDRRRGRGRRRGSILDAGRHAFPDGRHPERADVDVSRAFKQDDHVVEAAPPFRHRDRSLPAVVGDFQRFAVPADPDLSAVMQRHFHIGLADDLGVTVLFFLGQKIQPIQIAVRKQQFRASRPCELPLV